MIAVTAEKNGQVLSMVVASAGSKKHKSLRYNR